jgi:2-polyprenyl-3-methyl-5-hydroxy-6-metoxy-1,4-benzoquinol methylase
MHSIIKDFIHFFKRRIVLKNELKNYKGESELFESCIPSYCHSNLLASYCAWSRIFKARNLFLKYGKINSNVLDFGASSGELGRVLKDKANYDFIENNSSLSQLNLYENTGSCKVEIETLLTNQYDAIFCLDSLEHNDDYCDLIDRLNFSLKINGIIILSGPTENFIYKLGRKVAGFSGHYHVTNVYNIESYLEEKFTCVYKSMVPFHIPLFSISVWEKLKAANSPP